jgi:cell division septation protein DedD
MVNSFQAIGAEDSIRYYVGVYQSMFPSLNVKGKGIPTPNNLNDDLSLKPQRLEPKPYVVQIGAFGKNENARRLKLQVSQIGFDVEIVPVKTNGRTLHAVRIVRFKSQKEAEKVGAMVKKKLGIDYRALYRPKDQKK